MKQLVGASILMMSVLLAACATPSMPLATTAGTDPEAAKHNAEGIDHYNQGHWGIAKTHFEAAIKADPKAAEAHYNMALTLDKLGSHAEATDHFKNAAELAPGNSEITGSLAYKNHVRSNEGYDRPSGYGGMY